MNTLVACGLVAVVVAASVGPAAANPLNVQGATFVCDRGVMVPATFVTGPEDAVVVINVDGNQILLYQEPVAFGARYGWPSGGANYVWWVDGEQASLHWRENGQETLVLTCALQL